MSIETSNAAWAEETPQGWRPAERHNVVWFSEEPIRNEHKSSKEGRPIFDSVLYVHIRCPGDRLLEIDRKASDKDRSKYAAQLDAYRRKQDATTLSGTPLEMWPQLDRRQVAELKALNIFTVENLATLQDSHGGKIMGFHELRRKAENFLRAASGSAEFDKMSQELAKRDEQIAQMQEQFKAMQAQMATMSQHKKPGPKPRQSQPSQETVK